MPSLARKAALAASLAAPSLALAAPDFPQVVLPFLQDYCLDCHDDTMREGDLDLSGFLSEDLVMADRSIWASVYEKIESHQMPPPKKKRLPSAEQRAELLAWIEDIASRPDPKLGARDPGKPVLRRLTRLEYNNVVRDLLGLPLDFDLFMFPERLPISDRSYFQPSSGIMGDHQRVPLREYGQKYAVLLPQAGLPGDNRAEHGYRNRGEAMDFSPLLLEKHVQIAGQIAFAEELPLRSEKYARLIGLDPAKLPSLADLKPRPPGFDEAPVVFVSDAFSSDIDTMPKPEASPDWLGDIRSLVKEAYDEGRGGVVNLPGALSGQTIAGKGGLLKTQFGERLLTINPNEDLWLVDFATADEASKPLLMANKTKGSKVFELTFEVRSADEDEGIARLSVVVLGRKKQSGQVTLTAVFSDGTETAIHVEMKEGSAGTHSCSFAAIPGEHIRKLRVDGSQFSGDYVLLDDIGFVTNGSPQPATLIARMKPGAVVAGDEAEKARDPGPGSAPSPQPPGERLKAFVAEAFRRPVSEAETGRFLQLFESRVESGKPEVEAFKVVVQAVLSSPAFLFVEENGATDSVEAVAKLEDFELANRIAAFLWASKPDDELRLVAEAGGLRANGGIEIQVRRMLRDPRAKELSESFAVQWLRLDQVFTAKPDRGLFPKFYSGPQGKTTLHGATLVEPLLLFETVMVEDRPITDFIAPEYTWLNESLKNLYGITTPLKGSDDDTPALADAQGNREVRKKNNAGAEWHRVTLDDPQRGGFLTMSGPLVVTSFPFRTSPVKRGAWLLETVFNRPPTEPKVAFVIENDTKEAAQEMSIREKFEQHRSKDACYSCHVRLDPPGFALERFDPIGAWREMDGPLPVDAKGEWNGRAFDGPAGFKQAVMEKPEEFTRGFVEHLMSYALCRKLEVYDMPAVREVMAAAEADDWKFSRVVVEIAKSYPFRHVRTSVGQPSSH